MFRKASDWDSSTGARPPLKRTKRGGKSDMTKSDSSRSRSKRKRYEVGLKLGAMNRMAPKVPTRLAQPSGWTTDMGPPIAEVPRNPFNYFAQEDGTYRVSPAYHDDAAAEWTEEAVAVMDPEALAEQQMIEESLRKEKEEKEAREKAWNAEAKVLAKSLSALCEEECVADEHFLTTLREQLEEIDQHKGQHLVSILPYRLVCDMADKLEGLESMHWWKPYLNTDVVWSSLLRLQNKEMRHWLLQEESLAVVREEADHLEESVPSSVISVFSEDGMFDPQFRREHMGWDTLLHPHLIPPKSVLIDEGNAGKDVELPSGVIVRPSVVPYLSHFQRNFDIFSDGVLKGVNLSNAFIGGSAVTACLLPAPPHIEDLHRKIDDTCDAIADLPLPPELTEKIMAQVLNDSLTRRLEKEVRTEQEKLFRFADVDIFVTAETIEEGLETVLRIASEVMENLNDRCIPYFLMRTSNAVTICPGAPYRNVQVILMVVSSVGEALCYCDLDSTAFAFDGHQVLAVPRSRRAFNYRCNIISPTASQRRGGPSRINKYIQRGFCALMFELCYHNPRCDVEPSAGVLDEFRQIEMKRTAPYAEFLIYGTMLKMLEHLETVRQNWLPDAAPFVVGESLAEIGFGEPGPGAYATEARKEEELEAVEEANLPSVRWKRTELLLRNQNHHLLPKCYQCVRRNGFPLEVEAGQRRTIIPLCGECCDLNAEKRRQGANMEEIVALVTGGRIKIGFETAMSLLNNGALVIVTTRFPHDAAARFLAEERFPEWRHRLHIYGIDFRNLVSVQQFVAHIRAHYGHLDVLVNNAAQTIRRPPGYYRPLVEQERIKNEQTRTGSLPTHLLGLVKSSGENPHTSPAVGLLGEARATRGDLQTAQAPSSLQSAENALTCLLDSDRYTPAEELALFPPGRTDEHGLQLDLRSKTTWNSTIDEISVVEMAEVQMVNSVVPFVLTQQLLPSLQRTSSSSSDLAFIVNVTSSEGQFSAGKYESRHPHTNMAKASLNMLTRTVASQYRSMGIIVNSVDTGWISEMQPVGNRSYTAAVAPLGVADGAARVLDPVYRAMKGEVAPCGVLLKNFEEADW